MIFSVSSNSSSIAPEATHGDLYSELNIADADTYMQREAPIFRSGL
jgi:hypothetical protein